MTAISVPERGVGVLRDPVAEIISRIDRARSRLARERVAWRSPQQRGPTYPLFADGHLLGAVYAPRGAPVFGPAAPTVLLRRET